MALTCSLKLSRPPKTTPSSLGLGFDLSGIGTVSSWGLKDSSFVLVEKIVDDDLPAAQI